MAQVKKTGQCEPLSPSSMDKYNTCPRQYAWHYRDPSIRRQAVRHGEAGDIGIAAHEAFAAYQKHREMSSGPDHGWMANEAERQAKAKGLSENGTNQVLFHCRQFVDWEPFAIKQNPMIEAEHMSANAKGEWCQFFADDCYVRGKIDRMFFPAVIGSTREHPTFVCITDWKTGRRKVLDLLQLKLYCYLAKCRWPTLEKFEVTYCYTEDKMRDGPHTFTAAEVIPGAKAYLQEMHDKIAGDTKFDPTPSNDCNWCDYSHLCDEWKKLVVLTPSDMLRGVCQGEAFVASWKSQLKALLMASMETDPEAKVIYKNAYAEVRQHDSGRFVNVIEFVRALGKHNNISDLAKQFEFALPYLSVAMRTTKRLENDPEFGPKFKELVEQKGKATRDTLYIGTVDEDLPLLASEDIPCNTVVGAKPEVKVIEAAPAGTPAGTVAAKSEEQPTLFSATSHAAPEPPRSPAPQPKSSVTAFSKAKPETGLCRGCPWGGTLENPTCAKEHTPGSPKCLAQIDEEGYSCSMNQDGVWVWTSKPEPQAEPELSFGEEPPLSFGEEPPLSFGEEQPLSFGEEAPPDPPKDEPPKEPTEGRVVDEERKGVLAELKGQWKERGITNRLHKQALVLVTGKDATSKCSIAELNFLISWLQKKDAPIQETIKLYMDSLSTPDPKKK